MEGEIIVGLVAVVGLILVPSLAIAVRVSLKPMVEAVVLLREALGKTTPSTRASADADDTRARLAYLEAAVGELQESSAFFRELVTPEQPARALTGGSGATEPSVRDQAGDALPADAERPVARTPQARPPR